MRQLFIVANLASFLFAATFYNPQDLSYREGFEAALKAVEFQRKNEGIKPRKITFNKPFLIIMETNKMPISEVLFLQNIAHREGFETYLTRKFLTFGNFERRADAEEAVKDLSEKYQIKATIKEIPGDFFIVTYPSLVNEFYAQFLKQAEDAGFVVKVEVIEIEKQTKCATAQKITKPIKKRKVSYFTLKNARAMSYFLRDNPEHSSSFVEYKLKRSEKFILENTKPVTTQSGEKYYKVKSKNLYFNSLDVVF